MTAAPTGEACPGCSSPLRRTLFEATDRLYRTTDERFAVVECGGCGLMRLYPWPTPAELRRYYPDNYWFAPERGAAARLEDAYRRFVLRDHANFVVTALKGIAPGPLLDLGCGGALFGRMMRERGHPTVGLDFSRQAARVAWGANGVPVAVGDFAAAPLRPGAFAGITMFHVLEHLFDPLAYLLAAAEYLRDDGRLIVQVPNADCWQFVLLGEWWNGIDVPRHLTNFRTRDIEALLSRAGFEVVRQKYFSLRDNPAGLASSLAPGLDPMARRIRPGSESPRTRIMRNLLYFGLVATCVPFTLLEAGCRAGSTVMLEARKKPA